MLAFGSTRGDPFKPNPIDLHWVLLLILDHVMETKLMKKAVIIDVTIAVAKGTCMGA